MQKKAGQTLQYIPIQYIPNDDVAPFYYIRVFLSVCLNVKFSAVIKAKDLKNDTKGSVCNQCIINLLLLYKVLKSSFKIGRRVSEPRALSTIAFVLVFFIITEYI